jgi:4-alpha-glucanotransferase
MGSAPPGRQTARVLDHRRAGVLLHPTSLPGAGGNGTLGREALRFVDFLAAAGVSVWQVLPLGPTHADRSPYQCLSSYAGNPRLVDFALLEEWGWLEPGSAAQAIGGAGRRALLRAARAAFVARGGAGTLRQFDAAQSAWLDPYALYVAIREAHQHRPWWQWPAALRDREPDALARAGAELADELALVRFEQFVFFRQWQEIRDAARSRGILLFGDLPIFVAHDSAEVWTHRHYFNLDAQGQPRVVAGVPPDYFSETGQRWGNPLYDWPQLAADGFRFWVERLRAQFALFDLVRIDHFRGFQAYWEIPAEEATAVHGRWVKAPGAALFKALAHEFGTVPVVAEDLGVITPEVEALRDRFRLPGMRVLQFGFDGDGANPHRPHNHVRDCVVYTGTHDNDTTVGWFDSLPAAQQQLVRDYLGLPSEPMPWPLIRAALESVAQLAVVPMQDLLGLDTHHRMNLPGTTEGNWLWRFDWEQVPAELAPRLRALVEEYGRG